MKKKQKDNQINASSMADIAFLLLIFFLVTTTMDQDKGLLTLLPSMDEGLIHDNALVHKRNVLSVLVNANDELLVNSKITEIASFKNDVKTFVDNKGNKPNLSDSPLKALISLQNHKGTSYKRYFEVQNEIRAAYNELRSSYSKSNYGLNFEQLAKEQQKKVRQVYPIRLSEAEPEDYKKLSEVQ